MAIVNSISRKIHMDQWDIVKFQLTVYCYINRITLSELDLNCLTLLAITGEQTLGEFCDTAAKNEMFSSNQYTRNILTKMEQKNLIVKNGKNKKKISLNISNIQSSGNILLDYKILRVEPNQN